MSEPVFPTFVPTLNQHLVESVLGGKVDVLAHTLVGGTMSAVRLNLGIVGLAEHHGWQLVGVRPRLIVANHLPPHTAILHGVYPRGVLYLARLVEVERKLAREHVSGIVAYKHRAPRRGARCLHISLETLAVGGEPRLEHHILIVQIEVHCRIVYTRCLMQIDVKTVVGLHLQRCLHTRFGELCLRRIVRDRCPEELAYLRETRCNGAVLLRVIVAGQPPSLVVTGKRKLCMLLLNKEVGIGLLRKLVAQTHTIIVYTEAQVHQAACAVLLKGNKQLVIVVAYVLGLAPHGMPCLVKRARLCCLYTESVHQVVGGNKFVAKGRRLYNRLTLVRQAVLRLPRRRQLHMQLYLAAG